MIKVCHFENVDERRVTLAMEKRRSVCLAPSAGFAAETEIEHQLILGQIAFYKDFKYEDTAHTHKYMRVTHDMAMEDVIELMEKRWDLSPPRIMLMIVSNAGPLLEWKNTKQLDRFKKGLIKAANTTNMWIVTTGLNVGINQVIGEARADELKKREALKCHKHGLHHNKRKISHQPLTFIGITRQSSISYIDSLINGVSELKPVQIRNEGNPVHERVYELNPDHSHFIIVRDNTINRTGLNRFVHQFQRLLLYADSNNSSVEKLNIEYDSKKFKRPLSSVSVPIVTILINGGYESARLVLDNIKKETGVLVIRGTGGLADLIAFTYFTIYERGTRKWDTEYVENYLKPELSIKIAERFPSLRDNQLTRNLFRERIVDCVRLSEKNGQSFMTILNTHSSSCDLEFLGEHILRALFKSQQRKYDWEIQMQRDLVLCLDWNNPTVATYEVFKKDPGTNLKIEKILFERALLQLDREEFVDLFLREGFQLHKYLTPKCLKRLFLKSYEQEFFQSVCWEGVLGHNSVTKPSKDFLETDINYLIELLSDIPDFINLEEMGCNAAGIYLRNSTAAERKSVATLTIYSVLTDRPRLAKLLWKHSDQPVHLALVVSFMYERLVYYISDSTVCKKMEERSKEFAAMATAVLDAGYKESSCRAREVLSEKIVDWGYKAAIDVAASANNRAFMSHYCCQKWLTSVFLGQLRLRDLSWGPVTFPQWLKVILCATLIFPIYIWAFFVKGEQYDLNDHDEETDEIDHDDLLSSYHDALTDQDKMYLRDLDSDSKVNFMTNDPDLEIRALPGEHSKTKLHAKPQELFIHKDLPLWKMLFLVWSAPITKFWMFQISYIVFLCLFSLAVLYPSCGNWYLDISVCSWIVLIILENARRILILHKKFARSVPLLSKIFELILISSFVVFYFSARVVYVNQLLNNYDCKVILCIVLLYFYFRFIVIYLPISPTLGPLLYRIKLMILEDFINFMRMAVLVIASGGIVIHVTLYPDFPLSLELFRRIFHRAWFSMFLTPVDDLEPEASNECRKRNWSDLCLAGTFADYECPDTGIWAYMFTIQYFLLLKLILLTLLMALFSSTASKLITESDSIWKYQRYRLIMDFDSRLRLPAPLSIFSFVFIAIELLYRLVCYCLRCRGQRVKQVPIRESEKDYSFWKMVAEEHSKYLTQKEQEAKKVEKEMEKLMSMAEDYEYLKTTLRQLKVRNRNLERVVTNVVSQLELIKNVVSSKEDGTSNMVVPHRLARQSPYPMTVVQRFPVPDKFVPWEVTWIEYDAVIYSRTLTDFPDHYCGSVDEDILGTIYSGSNSSTSIPVYHWNSISNSASGIIDRQSWITDEYGQSILYKLDGPVPRNPMGRTGLRGKGALPRFGPNHFIYVVITRWLKTSVNMVERGLEVVVDRTVNRNTFYIPGSFVTSDRYETFRTLFRTATSSPRKWTNDEDIKTDCALPCSTVEDTEPFLCTVVLKGYMDDPWNTDNAWKEVELWHVHYPGNENVAEQLKRSLSWRVVTEDVFIKLPAGQGQLLTLIVNKLKPSVF